MRHGLFHISQGLRHFWLITCFLSLVVGFLSLVRVSAVTFCVTLAASIAAGQGSTAMAAFQICLQIWMATSLLADGLAVAGQVRNIEVTALSIFMALYHLCQPQLIKQQIWRQT